MVTGLVPQTLLTRMKEHCQTATRLGDILVPHAYILGSLRA